MRYHILKILFLVFSLLGFQKDANATDTNYIKRHKNLAKSFSKQYGIPYQVILGVAIVESGNGKSIVSKRQKNHFGIVGKNRLAKRKSRYKEYSTVKASYRNFCLLMTSKKFYKKLKGKKDVERWVDAISKSGYSEVPQEWKKKVLAAIKENKL